MLIGFIFGLGSFFSSLFLSHKKSRAFPCTLHFKHLLFFSLIVSFTKDTSNILKILYKH